MKHFASLLLTAALLINPLSIMAKEKITQNAGHNALGTFAPEFAHLNDDVLFGEVWNRDGLTPKQRSMITVSALIGKGITDSSLEHHLAFAKNNGVTRTEIPRCSLISLSMPVGPMHGQHSAWPPKCGVTSP